MSAASKFDSITEADQTAGMKSGDVAEAVRGYFVRVRGGEMGALPAVLATIVLIAIFWFKSPQFFVTRMNFANLTQQAATIVVFACALSFLIILTDIDLSAGVTGGAAMVVFIRLVRAGVPWGLALFAAFVFGLATGLFLGFWVSKIGVPSFVVSLGFFLGFQGFMLFLLGDGGTYQVQTKAIKALMNDSMSPALGWLMFAVISAGSIGLALYDRAQRTRNGLPNTAAVVPLIKVGLIVASTALLVFAMNSNRSVTKKVIQGVPIVIPFVLFLLFAGEFVLKRTRFGLHLYAVGSNPEAARRAGIRVPRMRIAGFVICSLLSVVAGLFNAGKVGTIESSAGTKIVLQAVAAAVVGGVSLYGGRGSLKNAAIGGLAIAIIDNGLGLFELSGGANYMITGFVLVVAATVDALSRKRNATSSIAR